MLALFLTSAFMLYVLAVNNAHNASITPIIESPLHKLQRSIIPVVCILETVMLVASRNIKKEVHHQLLWFFASVILFAGVMTNSVVWKINYDPSIVVLLEHLTASNPISLFYLTELGWFLTVVLVFFTVLVRPRFPYLVCLTMGSFVIFLIGAFVMRDGLAIHSVILRVVVYLFCCSV